MKTEPTSNRQPLEYWSVRDIDQPIGIVPFPCGRYVCPNHTVDDTAPATTCVPQVAVTAGGNEVPASM